MARRYVLGPNAARKLTELIRGSGKLSHRQGATSSLAFDSEYVAPFTVQWAQSADSGSGAWLVWLPSDKCLIVDGAAVDLTEELEAADDPYPTGWYVLEDVPASGGSVYLNVTPGDPEAAEEEDQVATAEFSASASQTEGDIPILVATVAKDSTTGAVTVKQTVTSALVFGTGKGDATPDDVSIELCTDQEDDEPGGDEGKLQFKDFDSDGSDSAKGLAERMKADPKTGVISVNDAGGLMLVARRKLNDGTQKLVYIPLSASGEDPDDEKAEGESDPCEHPGGGGVVVGDEGGAHGGGGGSLPPDGGGGVSAEGGAHIGDDGCNCD